MYSVEHEAQPEHFRNALSGIWWSVSTLLTVGYGDIAPATSLGRILCMIVMLMGYTIMAVPTGIVSAQMVHDHKSKHKEKFCPECGADMRGDDHDL